MLTALILVCSLTSTPDLRACTRDNALEVIYVPATFVSPVTCFMHGQAYLADTSVGRDLAENEAVKVVCVRSQATETNPARTRVRAQLKPDEKPIHTQSSQLPQERPAPALSSVPRRAIP